MTHRWKRIFNSPFSRFWYQLESCRGKLFSLSRDESHRILESVSLDSGDRSEILRVPTLLERHLDLRNGAKLGGFDDQEEGRLTQWLLLDNHGYDLEPDPDREVYLINTETNQVDHIIKLAQFSNCKLYFLGYNILSLPSESSQETKAQVYQLPDMKLLYEFHREKSWGNPAFETDNKVHYFYDGDLQVMHRFSSMGETHLEIPFEDLDYYKTDRLFEDTMIYEYIDEAPGLLTFVPIPLKPSSEGVNYAVRLIKRDHNMGYWSIERLSASILVIVDISQTGSEANNIKELLFWLKPNIFKPQKKFHVQVLGSGRELEGVERTYHVRRSNFYPSLSQAPRKPSKSLQTL